MDANRYRIAGGWTLRVELARPRRIMLILLAGLVLAGCEGTAVKRARFQGMMGNQVERVGVFHPPGPTTEALLECEGLRSQNRFDPTGVLEELTRRNEAEPNPDRTLALAELSYRHARRQPHLARKVSAELDRDAAVYAAFILNDPQPQASDLKRRCQAIEIHNRAVAQLIRYVDAKTLPGESAELWRQGLSDLGIACVSTESFISPDRLTTVTVASDYKVVGMQAQYKTDGLGVPIMGRRKANPNQSIDPQDAFVPRSMLVPATGVLEPGGALSGGAWRSTAQSLILHDPYSTQSLNCGGWTIMLASDRTAPLAAELDTEAFAQIAKMGLFHSDLGQVHVGLVMPQPYRPGKIPVVLVHGLYSSPATWMQTLNHLQNDPVLSSRYQFWLYLYPTGNPVLVSGMRLRSELALIRNVFDPDHQEPAFDQMVLVGHSMGGLLSKLQVQDPGDTLVQTMFTRPLDQIEATPELREQLDNLLLFQSRTEVKRVIFVATPHRGSRVANGSIGRAISRLIQRPPELQESIDQFIALNGPEVIHPDCRGLAFNSLGNLKFDNPTLTAMNQIPIRPDVTFHTVALKMGQPPLLLPTDGVVGYPSAHLHNAASELVVPGTHTDHQKIEVTHEIKRILRVHLEENAAAVVPPPAVMVEQPPLPDFDPLALRMQLESVRR